MKVLILDTNVLFSFFKGDKVFKLIEELTKKGVRLLTPVEMEEELLKLRHKIVKSAKLSEGEWKELSELLFSVVNGVPLSKYKPFLKDAVKVSPHKKDAPLFALSLAFNKCPIWSREPRLKRQKAVKVLSDKEVERLLQSKK